MIEVLLEVPGFDKAELSELVRAIFLARAIGHGSPVFIFSYPKNGLLAFLELVVFHFGLDHPLNGEDLGHGVRIVDLLDLVAQEDTLLFGPVCEMLNLQESLLSFVNRLFGQLILTLEFSYSLPNESFLLK